jgi:glucose/arabinose dehydrogenase/lysophospholipase L1-like esterase
MNMKPKLLFLIPLLSLIAGFCLSPAGAADSGPSRFELKKGDHICILGNTLAERMQHHGYLETLIQSRFPQDELMFRNLGFSGDEVKERLRVDGFGSPDDYLTRFKADVVFAFFGFNEAFAGEAGLAKFKKELKEFITHNLEQKYNGQSAPRLVLFSPIAHENLHDPNLPDGRKNNRNLKLYTDAMAAEAQSASVFFVNLFEPSQSLYAQSEQPLTINGIHLNDAGYRRLAPVIDEALFGKRPGAIHWANLETLRQAVLDKDFQWFHRYQTTDGYNVYGGRSSLKYVDNISNRDVLAREMDVLEAMSANRDKRIWARAQGRDLKVDDSNTPPFIEVKSNKPGPGPHGEYTFLGGEEAIGKMKPAPGMKVNLVASEEMFPELENPVQMAFDTRGRLWVAAWPSYPHWKPKTEMSDKLLILEDTNGDGRADKCTTFVDHLHDPTGFEFYKGGVLLAQAPYLVYLKDTDGDDRADVKTRLLGGLSSGDTHHTANSFVLDPGGALYFQEGVFHRTQTETPYGVERNRDACVWRFEPLTWKFERYVPYGFANPHGHVFDRWGQGFVTDGTGAEPFHDMLFSGHLDYPKRHARPPTLYNRRTRPCPGTEILSSRHFPEASQGNYLVANVIGFLGILQYKIEEKGASFAGTEVEPIVESTDPNFRPSDIEIGPDGAIWFTDWQNPIIGHMQHHLRDPSRDHRHGRVYRITYPERPLLKPAPIAGQPIPKLLDLLKEPENRVRYRARIELSGRDAGQVVAALRQWVDRLDKKDPNYEHHLTEALWQFQYHNVVNEDLLKRVLRSPDHEARAAATTVLCYWRDRVSQPLELLKAQANDENPQVRLAAVRACSFFRDPQVADVALMVLEHPMDNYLKFALDETMKQLDVLTK